MTAALALLLAALPACAQEGSEARPALVPAGGLLLFYNSQGPLSFVTMTLRDLPPGAVLAGEVKSRGCQHGLSIPIAANIRATSLSGAAGDGGYFKALRALKKERPELAGIYDVKVDLHLVSILGIYRRLCTEILARGFRTAGSP